MRTYYKDKLVWSTLMSYKDVKVKPSINSVTLEGNKSSFDLNMYTKDQVDALIKASRAIRVVPTLPNPTMPNTTYYVGPTSEANYKIWLSDQDNVLLDLGWAKVPVFIDGDGIEVVELPGGSYRFDIKIDGTSITLNSEGELQSQTLFEGEAMRIDPRDEGTAQISVKFDHDTVTLNSEGELVADSLIKPFIANTFLHSNADSELEWVPSSLNEVELKGDLNTEEVKVTWYGPDSEYLAIDEKNPYTLYVIDNGEKTVLATSYGELLMKPSINGVELVGNKTSVDLNMYTIGQIDNLIASVRTIKRAPTLPPKADRTQNALYYIGNNLPYDVYLIDKNRNETYLGSSAVAQFKGINGLIVHNDNTIEALIDNNTIGLTTDKKLFANEMVGATSTADGNHGLVPTPEAGELKFLKGDGTWDIPDTVKIVGEVKAYASNDIPLGWLLCDGREVSRATYSDLYDVIGDTFGAGDGNTTFNIPNLVKRFTLGASSDKPLGTMLDAGLPNVEGWFTTGFCRATGANSGFSLYGSGNVHAYSWMADNMGSGNSNMPWWARKSNAIYSKSDTVQPASVCLNYIIRT